MEAAAEALVGIWSHVPDSLDVRISPTQLRALTAVGRYGELNLSQLAEALGALPSSASRLCDRLEAAGLLTRDTGRASRRAVSLRLTADGENLLEQARWRRQAQIAQVLDVMPPAGRTELADGLAAFQRAAEPAGLADTDVGTDGSQGSGIPFSISSPYPRETGHDRARRSLGGRQNGRAAVSG